MITQLQNDLLKHVVPELGLDAGWVHNPHFFRLACTLYDMGWRKREVK
jgi:hypothetical protein